MINNTELLKAFIVKCLEEKKAEDVVVIDVKQKTTLTEYIVFASGRSTKNVGGIAEYLTLELKNQANINSNIEGLENSEWVLVDTGRIIVNIFYPETRAYFNLEKMWESK